MSAPQDPHLSQLATRWTLIVRAHGGGDDARQALAELLPRYCDAVYRYLLAVTRDPHTAEELCQEFAYRFVRGEFRHARPEKGRFRDYIKVSILHLISEYRRAAPAEKLISFDSRFLGGADGTDDDAEFRQGWTTELLNRAWAALRQHSEETGQLLYEALRVRADDPDRRSASIALELGARTGRSMTAVAVRQLLHRAREKFADMLWREVAESIPTSDPDEVRAELAELGLLAYCGPLLKNYPT